MNKLHDHLQHESEKFRMTDAEKSAMRARLLSAIDTGVSAAPAPSPYVWFFAPRMLVTSALALLLVVTTGTAYAAGDALPGGVFYPVKTGVLEPLAVALAPTTAAKAEANATIATRRVQEAQTLAAKGALTAETARTISDSYQVHAQAALALAKNADDDAGIVEDETAVADTDDAHTSVVVAIAPTASLEPTAMAMATGPADEPVSVPQTKSVVHLSVTATIAPPATTTMVEPIAPVARSMSAGGNPENQTSSETASSSAKVANKTSTGMTGSLQATSTKKSLRGKLNASLSAQAKILEELQLKLDTKSSSDDE